MKKLLLTITGPSGSGKTELVKVLTSDYNFSKLISTTTRGIREGEINGVDYYFINKDTQEYLDREDRFLEKVCFNEHYYGVTLDELDRVLNSSEVPVIIVEPSGVDNYTELGKTLGFEVVSLFITSPTEVLDFRYKSRLGGVPLTEYDTIRLTHIHEVEATWIDQRVWGMVIHNSTQNKENLKWFCKKVVKFIFDGGKVE